MRHDHASSAFKVWQALFKAIMSAGAVRHRFMVYAPDKQEEGTFERRTSVRPQHRVSLQKNIEQGVILVGGALATPESIAREDKRLIGSMFICEAESIEEVKKMVESDIYYTGNVWDAERIVILPMLLATPIPAGSTVPA
ncbi:hypothetical protein AX17_005725 [Amanita inopinata Kibby_2008]|nr:hypothetical protein AX17_005725 [Amanita inopinata Kibby_2008]